MDALTNVIPDLLLVYIGVNDIGRGRDPYVVATNHLPALLDSIFAKAPAANVVVTKVTTLRNANVSFAALFELQHQHPDLQRGRPNDGQHAAGSGSERVRGGHVFRGGPRNRASERLTAPKHHRPQRYCQRVPLPH